MADPSRDLALLMVRQSELVRRIARVAARNDQTRMTGARLNAARDDECALHAELRSLRATISEFIKDRIDKGPDWVALSVLVPIPLGKGGGRPRDSYRMACRALVANGWTLKQISDRTGMTVASLKMYATSRTRAEMKAAGEYTPPGPAY